MDAKACPLGKYRSGSRCVAFKSVHLMTSAEKSKVQKQYRNFLKALERSDATLNKFPKSLYEHLHLHCGFIAHYDRGGFYRTYFSNPEDTKHFLDHMKMKGCYHGASDEYRDISQALEDETDTIAPKIERRMDEAIRHRDIAQAKMLLKKHGVKF